ncbi:hypothetical protein [Bradyrhizobium sp. Cp5.3]
MSPGARSELRLICHNDRGVAGHAGGRFINVGEVDVCWRLDLIISGASEC